MPIFDPLVFLEHIWDESATEIVFLLLLIFGSLLIWVGLKRILS